MCPFDKGYRIALLISEKTRNKKPKPFVFHAPDIGASDMPKHLFSV